jgi:hypothetical protein
VFERTSGSPINTREAHHPSLITHHQGQWLLGGEQGPEKKQNPAEAGIRSAWTGLIL